MYMLELIDGINHWLIHIGSSMYIVDLLTKYNNNFNYNRLEISFDMKMRSCSYCYINLYLK